MKRKILLSSGLLLTLALGGCSVFEGFTNDDTRNIVYTCDPKVDPLSNPATSNETKYTLEELYEYAVTGTVTVLSYSSSYTALASGSGVIVEENRDEKYVYIITNAHVVGDVEKTSGYQTTIQKAEIFEVIYSNNQRVRATLVGKNPQEDIAVLKAEIDPTGHSNVITVADSHKVVPGQSVMAIGAPQGINYRNTATYGIISNTKVKLAADNDNDGTTTDLYLLQVDAALNPGNSGGPLFNMRGELIGINTMKLTTSIDGTALEQMAFAIPSSHAKLVADQLIETGHYSRPLLGVTNIDIGDLSVKEREDGRLRVTTGLYIQEVSLTGPCYNKLFTGDVIIAINDQCIETREDFCVELYKHLSGDVITFTVVDVNGENQRTVTVTLS